MSDKLHARFLITLTGPQGTVFTNKATAWNWVSPDATVLRFVDDDGKTVIVRPGCTAVVIREDVDRHSSD